MKYCYPIKSLLLLSLFILLSSCKAKQQATVLQPPTASANSIKEFHITEPDFKTLKINGDIEYTNKKGSQSAAIDIRIIKNEKILISVSYIIPIVKILLTPDSVSYYDMIHKTYSKGDYSTIKDISDIDFTFQQAQAIILGLPIYKPNNETFRFSTEDNLYISESILSANLTGELWLGTNNLLARQRVRDLGINPHTIDISYQGYTPYLNFFLPNTINITAEKNEKYQINITYNNCKVNEDFPFTIPKGYKFTENNY